jgi:hypothetical protein
VSLAEPGNLHGLEAHDGGGHGIDGHGIAPGNDGVECHAPPMPGSLTLHGREAIDDRERGLQEGRQGHQAIRGLIQRLHEPPFACGQTKPTRDRSQAQPRADQETPTGCDEGGSPTAAGTRGQASPSYPVQHPAIVTMDDARQVRQTKAHTVNLMGPGDGERDLAL